MKRGWKKCEFGTCTNITWNIKLDQEVVTSEWTLSMCIKSTCTYYFGIDFNNSIGVNYYLRCCQVSSLYISYKPLKRRQEFASGFYEEYWLLQSSMLSGHMFFDRGRGKRSSHSAWKSGSVTCDKERWVLDGYLFQLAHFGWDIKDTVST